MNSLTVSQGAHVGMTMLSNRFIDEYMNDANDAQLKVYLYLLRCAGSAQATGISAIADHFNFTEKDIMRALQYWDKKHIISLLYDDAKKLAGIRLENLDAKISAEIVSMPTFKTSVDTPAPVYDKSVITLDQIRAFKQKEQTAELVFVTEQYLGKPLSTENIRSLIFMEDHLNFSTDLIDYLIQYCVDRGKRDFRYIEKVAISWAEAGITTPEEAALRATKYDRDIYTVMNALGRTGTPTKKEASYIHKWLHEYGFSTDIILVACERCAIATDKHRFEYTDGILSNWRESGVHSMQDIQDADAAFQKKKTAKAAHSSSSANPFHQFPQNQYDYDELLQKVKIN